MSGTSLRGCIRVSWYAYASLDVFLPLLLGVSFFLFPSRTRRHARSAGAFCVLESPAPKAFSPGVKMRNDQFRGECQGENHVLADTRTPPSPFVHRCTIGIYPVFGGSFIEVSLFFSLRYHRRSSLSLPLAVERRVDTKASVRSQREKERDRVGSRIATVPRLPCSPSPGNWWSRVNWCPVWHWLVR